MTLGVIFIDREGTILNMNPAAEKILGINVTRALNLNLVNFKWDIFNEDGSLVNMAEGPSMKALLKGVSVCNTVIGIRRFDSRALRWLKVNATPLFEEGSNIPNEVYTTIEDITESRNALHSLRLTQFSVDKAFDSVFWIDEEGKFIYVNERACSGLGYSREELLHMYIDQIDPSYARDKWVENWKRYEVDRNRTQHMETVHKRKNGEIFPVEVVSEHHWVGNEVFHVAYVRDITERRETLESLKKSEERFRIIFNQAALGVCQVETDTGKFIRVNRKLCEILGYSMNELMQCNFMEITHPEDLELGLENMQRLISGEVKEFDIEKRYMRKDGSFVWTHLTVSPMWAPGEPPNYHISIIEDITISKEAADAKAESEKRLRELNVSKDKLFSVISHDLRNPFQSIIGFSDLLINQYNSLGEDNKQEFLKEINTNSKRAFVLLDNLLKWTMGEQGRILLNIDKIHVESLVMDCLDMYISMATNKKIDVVLDIESDLHALADANTLRTISGNLIANAIKFTPEGGKVEILGRKTEDHIRIIVRDNGTGMEPAMVDAILQGEGVESQWGTNNEKGTGLGLRLVTDFIARNGGSLAINSSPGAGSDFIVTLPGG